MIIEDELDQVCKDNLTEPDYDRDYNLSNKALGAVLVELNDRVNSMERSIKILMEACYARR